MMMLVSGTTVKAQQTVRLFDGKSLDGWTTGDGKPVTEGWEVVDGALHLKTGGPRGGNIVTEQEYGDFDLSFDWKIAPGGNNGLKYRVRKFDGKTLGLEYQMIDDGGYRTKLPPKGSTGALYDIYEPSEPKPLIPPGQFNHSRIVVCGDRIEHWLNGKRIVLAYVGSDEWNQRIAESKFADVVGFGRNREGKIMLTDHNSEVWYRNITLTPLAAPERCRPVCTRRGILRRIFGLRR